MKRLVLALAAISIIYVQFTSCYTAPGVLAVASRLYRQSVEQKERPQRKDQDRGNYGPGDDWPRRQQNSPEKGGGSNHKQGNRCHDEYDQAP